MRRYLGPVMGGLLWLQGFYNTTATPATWERRVLGSGGGRQCVEWLPQQKSWRLLWRVEEEGFQDHASLIIGNGRALVLGFRGDLLLLDLAAPVFQPLARLELFADEELYAFPAVANGRLYVRARQVLRCYALQP